jgi:hypothetical protein
VIDETADIFGQIRLVGKLGASDPDWNRSNVTLQRSGYLKTDPIVRIVETPSAYVILDADPVGSNQREKNFALGKPRFENFGKPGAGRHVNIYEDVLSTELAFKILPDAERKRGTILPSIAYEDFTCHA